MTKTYTRGTAEQIEELHQKARTAYLAAFLARYPESQTRVARNYTDRITGIVADTVIQLDDTNTKDHADRLDDPIKHPDYPNTNLWLLGRDPAKESDELDRAFYFKTSERGVLQADVALTDIDEAEATRQGFLVGEET